MRRRSRGKGDKGSRDKGSGDDAEERKFRGKTQRTRLKGRGSGDKAEGRKFRGQADGRRCGERSRGEGPGGWPPMRLSRTTVGPAGASTLEFPGAPHGALSAFTAEHRLTNDVREAPDFSGVDGVLTLLSFFLFGYFLFPETQAEENTDPHRLLQGRSWCPQRPWELAIAWGHPIPKCPKDVPPANTARVSAASRHTTVLR